MPRVHARHVSPLTGLMLVSFAGCATVDPRPDYERAREEIRATTGVEAVHDPDEAPLRAEEITAILVDGLSLGEAVQLALVNNRRLHAGFLGLGVARAEHVQAGLLRNPSLSLALLVPEPAGRVRWTADLLGSVAEIWQIPSRQALAAAGIEQKLLELAGFASQLAAATRQAYLQSVGARAARSVARENAELARQSLAGIRQQVEEGVATRTDEGLAESLALGAELVFQRSQREVVSSTRELAALLSLERDLLDVPLSDPLPEAVWPETEREALVAASLALRPDVRAAEHAVAAARERVSLERRRRSPEVDLGLSIERPEGESSADWLAGPAGTIELPLFDQNQAQVSRAELELGERRKEHEALVAEAVQQVRAALDRAEVAARAAAFARDELVPQAERSASLAEMAYRLGDTTVLTLLEARRTVLAARQTEIEARLEAALSGIDVERATGAPLETLASAGHRP